MSPPFEEQELETYYPWTSLEENGLQPVVGLKITMNSELNIVTGYMYWY